MTRIYQTAGAGSFKAICMRLPEVEAHNCLLCMFIPPQTQLPLIHIQIITTNCFPNRHQSSQGDYIPLLGSQEVPHKSV
jgi:hypothetical protein